MGWLTVCLVLLSGKMDGDVYVERFPYTSPAEATLIKSWVYQQKLPDDIVAALLVAENVVDPATREQFRKQIQALAAELRKKGGGKPEKLGKTLYKRLHKDVLYTYEPLARFQDVFNLGSSYNCVTSTSLFAVVAGELGLPVKLYVTPSHVFSAITDSKGRVLRVEMTDPVKGFNFKTGIKESLEYLKRYKLVTEEDLKTRGERQIYLEFVNQAREIPTINLVAITYYNQTYAHMVKKRYAEGARTIAKSLLIDPEDAQSKSMLQHVLSRFYTSYDIGAQSLDTLEEMSATAIYFNREDPDFLKQVVETTLYQIAQGDKGEPEEVLGFLESLMLRLKDFPPLKQRVSQLHRQLLAQQED